MTVQQRLDMLKAVFESGAPPYDVSRERIETIAPGHRGTPGDRSPLGMELQDQPAVRASYERVPRSSPSLRRWVSMDGPCPGARSVARGEGARLVDVDGRG